MRQTDLAETLGLPEQTLNNWIRGQHPIDKASLPNIIQALKAHKPGPIQAFRAGSRSPKF
jgi:transcriptional regulator with XRE-family HTH domain